MKFKEIYENKELNWDENEIEIGRVLNKELPKKFQGLNPKDFINALSNLDGNNILVMSSDLKNAIEIAWIELQDAKPNIINQTDCYKSYRGIIK